MNTAEHYSEHWHEVPRATHIVVVDDQGATVLCEGHMMAMKHTLASAGVPVDIHELPQDEPPIACQACHLAEVNRPKIIVH
jgi:hypothetical protein